MLDFSDKGWGEDDEEIAKYVKRFDGDLDALFKNSSPEDLDELIKSVKGKKKVKKYDDTLITKLADKYDLPCHYVMEEFMVDDKLIDPDTY